MWIALGGYAAERNHGYITELLLLGSEAGAAVRRRGSRGRQQLRVGSSNPVKLISTEFVKQSSLFYF